MNTAILLLAILLSFNSRATTDDGVESSSDVELRNWLREYMTFAQKFDRFGGVVLVARKGEPFFHEAYGMANHEWNVPNTLDTKFRIGSVSKTFTAAGIVKLAEEGKLNLDDPISKHIDNCPATWAKITIRHLLVHTSGLVNYTSLPAAQGDFLLKPHSRDEVLELFRDMPLASAPGEKYSYNNSGYFLLGIVIEKHSGGSCESYLRKVLFEPLGLENTGFEKDMPLLTKRASGYRISDTGNPENTFYMDMENASAIGGLYSTAEDLLAWDQSFNGNQIFSPQVIESIFVKDENSPYGLGWVVDKLGDSDRAYHDGGITDFSASIQRLTSKQITVIVISNQGSDAAIKVAYDISGKICSYPATVRGFHGELTRLKCTELLPLIDKAKGAFPRFRINEGLIVEIAKDLESQGNVSQAIEVYSLNCLLFQTSETAFSRLGEALLTAGRKREAKEMFQKCLELNPKNETALRRVVELDQ